MITSDLGLWYEWYAETGCPNCGINMRKLHPEANLFPHFTGACKTPVPIESERSWEQPARRTRQNSLVKWGCVFLAVAILLVLGLVATSHGEDRAGFSAVQVDPHPASPRLQTRRLAGDPFIGDDNAVHNQPSMHRNWMARHPRIMGAIAIGAAAGVGAGIARAQHRGICREGYPSGYVYVGTCPLPADH